MMNREGGAGVVELSELDSDGVVWRAERELLSLVVLGAVPAVI